MSMKNFNKATLAMAVASVLAASSAQAVNLAEDGLGEYIISPLYTVRDGFETYINVHNTSEETVIFKIRFREHYNSRDVRDFNVVLSPFDVWTAAVTLNEDGDGARVVTRDHSCTIPIAIRDQTLVGGYDVNDFVNWAYTGANDDGGPTSLERTTQGYFEIINMGQDAENPNLSSPNDNDTLLAQHGTHVPNSVRSGVTPDTGYAGDYDDLPAWAATETNDRWPRNCTEVERTDQLNDRQFIGQPENSLKVNAAIINVNDGLGFAIPVTTLANFYNPTASMKDGDDAPALSGNINLMYDPSDDNPNVTHVFPRTSETRSHTVGTNNVATWAGAWQTDPDPVSAVLMRLNVINQFRVQDGVADTDWVATFPTKNYYVDPDFYTSHPPYPFVEMFGKGTNEPRDVAGSCFDVTFNIWDREEDAGDPSGVLPSPLPPDNPGMQLCREMNIIRFGDGVLHGNGYQETVTELTPEYSSGWMRMDIGPADADLANAYDLTSSNGYTYEGLPVIGFALQNLDNWNVANDMVQYGFAWEHSYGR